MRLAYPYYFQNYRSDFFLQAQAKVADCLHILDFVPLRQVFRRNPTSVASQRERTARLLEGCRAKVHHHVCPALWLGGKGLAYPLGFALSLGIALLWSVAMAFFLLTQKLSHFNFYNGHPLYLPLLAVAKLRRCPVATDLGDILYLLDNPNGLTRALELFFLRHSDRVISVSLPFKRHLVQELGFAPERISVLSASLPRAFPEAFDEARNAERRLALRQALGVPEGELVLGYAGGRWFRWVQGRGIIDVQGLDLLCQAVDWLNEHGTPCHLVILGTPADEPDLQPFVAGKHQARFHLWGRYKPLDERHCQVLGGADLLCIPSAGSSIYRLYDRFKMYEYLAAGKTCVVADVPINHDVYGDDAVYFPDDDWQAMAQVIQKEACRAVLFNQSMNTRAAERYTWDERLEAGAIERALFANTPETWA